MGKTPSFSHIHKDQPAMVDISGKDFTERLAVAKALLKVPLILGAKLREDGFVNAKGPVFHTAIVAGTMAAKNTSALIPFCHALALSQVKIDIALLNDEAIEIHCQIKTYNRTGVEMEALMGASIAALTIYDMCKSVSSDIIIHEVKLVRKTGGKHDYGS